MDDYEAQEEERKKMQELQNLEQSGATLGDFLPPLWRRLHENLIKEGFTETQAFDLLKSYILGSSGGRITPN